MRVLAILGLLVAAVLVAVTYLPGMSAGGIGLGSPRGEASGACHVNVSSDGLPEADRRKACTPGSARALGRKAACRHKERPDLPASVRDAILARYGVPEWTGKDGELDHLIPFWAGGRTTRTNLWVERGSIPNVKDRLELAVFRAVCDDKTMTPAEGRAIFRKDWRTTYRVWKADGRL